MSRNQLCEAIVLKTYDVGEADRYCVLFTAELGRVAARARGVRKPKSKMGGSLLPLRQLAISLHNGKTGYTVTNVARASMLHPSPDVAMFLQQQRVAELLLKLLHDNEPMPDVYELTRQFLMAPNGSIELYTQHLLTLMGYVSTEQLAQYDADKAALLCRQIVLDHSSGTLTAANIARQMQAV